MARLTPAWVPLLAVTLPAAGTAALGAWVLAAWLGAQPVWLAQVPGSATMVASTAFALLVAGAGVLAAIRPTPPARALRMGAGATLAALGALVLAQHLADAHLWIDFADLHRPLDPLGATPGRMPAATAAAMLITALLLFAFDRPRTRLAALAVQVAAGALLAIGIASLVAYDVSPEGVFPWYRYSRMAATTAAAVIALGIAFLALIARSAWYAQIYASRADERILVLALGILSLVLAGVGAAALAVLQRHMEVTVRSVMTNAVDNRVALLESLFAGSISRASIVGTRPGIRALLDEWEGEGSASLRARLREEAQGYLGEVFRGIAFYDEYARPIVQAGTFASEPTLEAPVRGQSVEATLLWNDDTFVLRLFAPVHRDGRWVGSVLSEQELDVLRRLHFHVEELGKTAEWVMCSSLGSTMGCYPQRFVRSARVLPRRQGADALPVDHALDGRRGFMSGADYDGERVIAAYGPVGATGLGVAVRIAATEFYAPLRSQVAQWGQWFFAMALMGALLVASQVRPVAQRLVQSEELARVRAEALARSEGDMRAIYASLGDGVMVLTEQGVIEFLNPAAARIFGYPEGELVGKPVGVLLPEEAREANARATRRFLDDGVSGVVGRSGMVYPALRRDGTRIDVEFSLSPMRQHTGVRLVGVVRDVSERTALERMKGEFVAGVSHELRTPLTSILGALELAAEADLPEPQRGFVDMARRNSQRLAALVNDVIDAARLDGDSLTFRADRIAAGPFAAEAVELNQPYAAALGVTLRLEDRAGGAEVVADRGRLMQVVSNLVSNAAKFSPSGGEVRLRVAPADGRVRMEVIDHGRGIPDDFKPRVFERFAQADASDSREKGGTGLGLAIAKGLVERMGGTIGFHSRIGWGSTFWIELPALDGAGSEPEAARGG